jgi:benzoyl-CoA reductase/2-hydroxyglutaryl-CoA dehydratase subunit BcrC/BadD/HgdB
MVRAYIDFKLFWPEVYILRADKLQRRFDFDKRIFQQWRTDFVFVHLNGGCEATCLNQPELKSFLVEQGIPTLAFEGSMADHRDIDLNRLLRNIDTFFEAVVR